jgi:hypothetical protein
VPTIGDGVTKVVLVPTTWDPGNETVYQTGYSGRPWADTRVSGKFNGTYDSSDSFWELLKPYKYISYTVNKSNAVTSSNVTASQIKKENEWVDLTVPWPTGGATGYFVYFIETDKRVRGYCNPAKGLEADGDVTKNFQFFIRPDYLYANRRIPMGITSSNGHLQVNPSSTAYREVIPVSYTDWENVASIMTARGVGSRPKLNYTGLNVSGISYKE